MGKASIKFQIGVNTTQASWNKLILEIREASSKTQWKKARVITAITRRNRNISL